MIKSFPARWLMVALSVVLTGALNLTGVQESEKAGILRPTDRSVVEADEVQIIARAGEVWLDGKALKERPTQEARQAVSIRIASGKHELIWKNGDDFQRIQFAVKTSGNTTVPPGWKVYRAHPPQTECQNCHSANEGFKAVTVADTCFTCHVQKSFAAVHAHNGEVLADCVLCHNPHGSTEKFHLKMTRETACKQCHG